LLRNNSTGASSLDASVSEGVPKLLIIAALGREELPAMELARCGFIHNMELCLVAVFGVQSRAELKFAPAEPDD